MAVNLFGMATPALGDEADGSTAYAMGTRFITSAPGVVTHGRWRFPTTIPSPTVPVQIGLYDAAGPTLIGSAEFPLNPTLGAWNQVAFPSPIAISPGNTYAVVVWTPLRYTATPSYAWPATAGRLTADPANGWLAANVGALAFPTTQSANAASYFADVVFEETVPAWSIGYEVTIGV